METKKYWINGNGNYSHEFNWDDGLSIGKATLISEDDELTFNEYAYENPSYANFIPENGENGDISMVFTNEHGGSRNVTVVVFATTKNRAERYARVWAGKYYPAHY